MFQRARRRGYLVADVLCTVFCTGLFADYLCALYVLLLPVAISGALVELEYFACQILGPRCPKWESDYLVTATSGSRSRKAVISI